MDRYLIDGLLSDARRGRRVLFLAATLRQALNTFHEAVAALGDGQRVVSRANGRWEIADLSGGSIRFGSLQASHRGDTADVIVVEDRGRLDLERWREIQPIVAATRCAGQEVVRL